MEQKATNIHPTFDQLLQRSDKEDFLNQKSTCLWLTGLSGSGKTTIAKGLEQRLHKEGFFTQLLDGDNVRSGLCKNLTFSIEDRYENIRRISEINKLLVNTGVITINCFVSPTKEIRDLAKDIIGDDYKLIFINTSLEECERRDVKGLYAKARRGEIKNFTGIDSPFEIPTDSFLEVKTEDMSIDEAIDFIYDKIKSTIKYTSK